MSYLCHSAMRREANRSLQRTASPSAELARLSIAMYPLLESREAAVEWLAAKGLYAAPRDWSFGESVVAASGRQVLLQENGEPIRIEGLTEELVVYANMICIYPEREGWSVAHLSGGKPGAQSYLSLGQAAFEAAKLLVEAASVDGASRDAQPVMAADGFAAR